MSKKESRNRKFKISLDSCTPHKLADGKWTYSFYILPEVSLFWLGGLQCLYISWLFWSIFLNFNNAEL